MKWPGIAAMVLVGLAQAQEPSYVRTTTYQTENDATTAIVSTTFSDGLGRTLQTKQKISETSGLVSSSVYDAQGRVTHATKPFVDGSGSENFFDGDAIEAANAYYLLALPTTVAYQTDYPTSTYPDAEGKYPHAYSETKYSSDPLGRVKAAGAPGTPFSLDVGKHVARNWYLTTKIDVTTPATGMTALGFADIPTTGQVTFLDGLEETPPYDEPTHFLTVTSDANGNFSQEIKDSFGRTVRTRSDAGSAGTKKIVAQYTYDISGNLISEAPPAPSAGEADAGAATTYQYNTLGQMTKKCSPDLGGTKCVSFVYDAAGRVTQTTKADGTVIYNTYDDFGRLVETGVMKAGVPTPRLLYEFDELTTTQLQRLGLPISWTDASTLQFTTGRLTGSAAVDETGANRVGDIFSYDKQGRVAKRWKVVSGLSRQLFEYDYDLAGRVRQETRTSGTVRKTFLYLYDNLGRLEKIVDGEDSKVLVKYEFDEKGMLTTKKFGPTTSANAASVAYDYNIRNWLTGITSEKYTEELSYDHPTTTAAQFNGNIWKAAHVYDPGATGSSSYTLDYQYDGTNRLYKTNIAETDKAAFAEDFAYDNRGRFVTKKEGSTQYTYAFHDNATTEDGNSNRLRRVTGTSDVYFYDANGNMVVDKTKKMTIQYDWRDMPVTFTFYSTAPVVTTDTKGFITSPLSSITQTKVSEVHMLYDAAGNRVYKMEKNL